MLEETRCDTLKETLEEFVLSLITAARADMLEPSHGFSVGAFSIICSEQHTNTMR